jgi:hypothetical protein
MAHRCGKETVTHPLRAFRFAARRALREPTVGDWWVRAIGHYLRAEHLETPKPFDDW